MLVQVTWTLFWLLWKGSRPTANHSLSLPSSTAATAALPHVRPPSVDLFTCTVPLKLVSTPSCAKKKFPLLSTSMLGSPNVNGKPSTPGKKPEVKVLPPSVESEKQPISKRSKAKVTGSICIRCIPAELL